MTNRTYEIYADNIEVAEDFEELVKDKRENWRANITKRRQRQRRYKKRLTKQLLKKYA
jgi:elongation factor P--beta-lysine ligase